MFELWSVPLSDVLMQVNDLYLKYEAYQIHAFSLILRALFLGQFKVNHEVKKSGLRIKQTES